MKTKKQQEIEKGCNEIYAFKRDKSGNPIDVDCCKENSLCPVCKARIEGYTLAKKEAEAKQKEFIEKLKEIIEEENSISPPVSDGLIYDIDKLSQEVFAKSEVGK